MFNNLLCGYKEFLIKLNEENQTMARSFSYLIPFCGLQYREISPIKCRKQINDCIE